MEAVLTQQTLQLINILLTGGVLVALLGAAVAYGRLTQKVEVHDRDIANLWDAHANTTKRIDAIVEHK